MTAGERVAARARAAVGTPFRLHGRDPAGVDCVGLAAIAYETAVPTGYRLRTGDAACVAKAAVAVGLQPASSSRPGDLIVMASGPGQLHLGIATADGFVHADAALARVVERPGIPPWPVVACWRKGD